jgi:hypothetical protein
MLSKISPFTLRVRIYRAVVVVRGAVSQFQQCTAGPADLPTAQPQMQPRCLYNKEPGEANASHMTLRRLRYDAYLIPQVLQRLQYNWCTEGDHNCTR